jgi:hypothetical protein
VRPTNHRRSLHSTMSHPQPIPSSSTNFQLILNNALKTYQKHTKCDLLAHPLAAQLQGCESPSAILAIIHQQVEGLHQSQRADERLIKWLNPTINVLNAFSATLGAGVGLVCIWLRTLPSYIPLHYFPGIFSCTSYLCRSRCPSFSAYSS